MITIPGYSGCQTKLFRRGDSYLIEKSTEDPNYVPRLLKQRDKQIEFFHSNKLPEVIVPQVLYTRKTVVEEDPQYDSATRCVTSKSSVIHCTVAMNFLHHTDALTFLNKASVGKIRQFTNILLKIMDQYTSLCSVAAVSVEKVFISKLDDIARVVARNECINASVQRRVCEDIITNAKKLFREHGEEILLPIGACHGDLTLSNILIRDDSSSLSVVLIDFLDNFVESPLADLAKLNQDLAYGWTLRLMTASENKKEGDRHFNALSLFTVFKSIREVLETRYSEFSWYRNFFHLMALMNQLRVLQYSKDPSATDYLVKTIEMEFQKLTK